MPAYDAVRANGHSPRPADPDMIGFDLGRHRVVADLERLDLGEVPVTLIDVPSLYHRGDLYTEAPDEPVRFAVLSRAAVEACRRWSWAPDVIHCNDWQTGLIPLYLHADRLVDGFFAATRTVFTIHNLAYQGVFDAAVVTSVGLDDVRHLLRPGLTGGRINFLETGLTHADLLTTVSPTYASEILTPEHGCGLEALLRRRRKDLVGILNGIDTEVWNPVVDRLLPHRYSSRSLWRKEWNKDALLDQLQLDGGDEPMVFGVVSRLVSQKGIGLIPYPMSGVLDRHDARFVALGTGEPEIESSLRWLEDRFPGRARFVAGYDEALSHRIEAGADVFMMPSQYEPSGLNQMYSLAYGTPPLVRRTGGLADTVEHWDPETRTGTGFVFEHYDEAGVWWALNEALRARRDRQGWKQLQLNGMAVDNSWDRAAARYEDVYRSAMVV